jgi:hypothetical protein
MLPSSGLLFAPTKYVYTAGKVSIPVLVASDVIQLGALPVGVVVRRSQGAREQSGRSHVCPLGLGIGMRMRRPKDLSFGGRGGNGPASGSFVASLTVMPTWRMAPDALFRKRETRPASSSHLFQAAPATLWIFCPPIKKTALAAPKPDALRLKSGPGFMGRWGGLTG